MKRICQTFVLVLFLSACSAIRPSPTPGIGAAAASPTTANTPTRTPTFTATSGPPTFTLTPTLIGLPKTPRTNTPLPEVTDIPQVIGINTVENLLMLTPVVVGGGFNTINLSGNKILWGVCEPGSVLVTAIVTEPELVYSVVFFVRLKDSRSDDTTPWSKGAAMDDKGGGIFVYELNADTVHGRNHYSKAWVMYQLVATDETGEIVARSPIFIGGLTIGPCM